MKSISIVEIVPLKLYVAVHDITLVKNVHLKREVILMMFLLSKSGIRQYEQTLLFSERWRNAAN